ncbi:SRPBCC family protein [Acuticoccus sp. M5D2P5]|uniref:SRPBCC family protein n=1 Tax=Acuticoccus kalidii TaxID=2910977 RepID=UPI001F376125|nr:SRPBCC family protein [Acuticoccus kalidii]MCF3935908.1 SRPBCC family protein [Acuticoccus kalidii]
MTQQATSLMIEKEVRIAAPVDRVWRALTDYREFGTWFRVALDGPFEVGRSVRGTMTYPGHEGAPFEATIEVMETPRRFVYSWVPDGAGDGGPDEPRTRVEFTLMPTEAGTTLVVRETGFEAVDPDRRVGSMRSHDKGWTAQLQNIEEHVAA